MSGTNFKCAIPNVIIQPPTPTSMDLYRDYHVVPSYGEKHFHEPHSQSLPSDPSDYDCECSSRENHSRCHSSRLHRLLLVYATVSLLFISAVLFFACMSDFDILGLGIDGLAKRATDTAGNNSNTFVHNKLYLIAIFVGLLLVAFLGVMLSAWCCKGSFENPLCCPCYLCACCGGLACLECIGCGLCAEGLDQM